MSDSDFTFALPNFAKRRSVVKRRYHYGSPTPSSANQTPKISPSPSPTLEDLPSQQLNNMDNLSKDRKTVLPKPSTSSSTTRKSARVSSGSSHSDNEQPDRQRKKQTTKSRKQTTSKTNNTPAPKDSGRAKRRAKENARKGIRKGAISDSDRDSFLDDEDNLGITETDEDMDRASGVLGAGDSDELSPLDDDDDSEKDRDSRMNDDNSFAGTMTDDDEDQRRRVGTGNSLARLLKEKLREGSVISESSQYSTDMDDGSQRQDGGESGIVSGVETPVLPIDIMMKDKTYAELSGKLNDTKTHMLAIKLLFEKISRAYQEIKLEDTHFEERIILDDKHPMLAQGLEEIEKKKQLRLQRAEVRCRHEIEQANNVFQYSQKHFFDDFVGKRGLARKKMLLDLFLKRRLMIEQQHAKDFIHPLNNPSSFIYDRLEFDALLPSPKLTGFKRPRSSSSSSSASSLDLSSSELSSNEEENGSTKTKKKLIDPQETYLEQLRVFGNESMPIRSSSIALLVPQDDIRGHTIKRRKLVPPPREKGKKSADGYESEYEEIDPRQKVILIPPIVDSVTPVQMENDMAWIRRGISFASAETQVKEKSAVETEVEPEKEKEKEKEQKPAIIKPTAKKPTTTLSPEHGPVAAPRDVSPEASSLLSAPKLSVAAVMPSPLTSPMRSMDKPQSEGGKQEPQKLKISGRRVSLDEASRS